MLISSTQSPPFLRRLAGRRRMFSAHVVEELVDGLEGLGHADELAHVAGGAVLDALLALPLLIRGPNRQLYALGRY